MKQINYNISENLPTSLEKKNVVELAEVVDAKIHEIEASTLLINIYPNIDHLPSDLVDQLAIQLHVDFYDTTLSLAKRRALVKNSIRWHMKKGTKSAVQEIVRTVFNTGFITEWFEYGGDPYRFRVDVIESDTVSMEEIELVVKAINSVKNVRSWLDGIGFNRQIPLQKYKGCIVSEGKGYIIGPPQPTDSVIDSSTYRGAAVQTHKEVILA